MMIVAQVVQVSTFDRAHPCFNLSLDGTSVIILLSVPAGEKWLSSKVPEADPWAQNSFGDSKLALPSC